MRFSYQNVNLRSGNESTLLRFTEDGTRACLLVDAGDGVDLDAALESDEYLNAILLTHAHIDHYRSLGANVRHNAPIYASPATATVLERALPEARKDNDLGDVDAVLEALEPIDDWVSILDGLEVRPVPAGHTPGAAGFLCRFRDSTRSSETPLPTDEHHVLLTGDFTLRPCAGYPPIARTYPVDIDAVFLNASTNDAVVERLNEALRTILEHAYGGSRVVVATSSLTGVHVAALLERLATTLDRSLPIRVVGQTARIYDALAFDASAIETREVFDDPSALLEQGGVTIAGPDVPTRGSAQRLLDAIRDDPAAAFVQLPAGDTEPISNANCTTRAIPLSNHPSQEAMDDFVRALAPRELVVKHASGHVLNEFQRRYDRCFTWGTDDEDVHVLYDDGWTTPPWLGDGVIERIRRKQRRLRQDRTIDAAARPRLERGAVDLEAEGVDLDAMESRFSTAVSDPYEDDCAAARSGDREPSGVDATGDEPATTGSSSSGSAEAIPARVLGDGDGKTILDLLEQTELRPGEIVDVVVSRRDDS